MASDAVQSAVVANDFQIPLIDFGSFSSGNEGLKQETARAILSGFQRAGFIYLKNHGVDPSKVKETFGKSAQFFDRPLAQKQQLSWTVPQANRGWVSEGREKTSDATNEEDVDKQRALEGQDLKEAMDIGREGDGYENHWPDRFDEDGRQFKQHMLEFFEECKQLHVRIMRAIAVGLGIEETWFDSYCDAGDNTLRLLHYPAVSTEVFRKNKLQVRAGAHTDFGSITLLFQDMAGGLQVQSPDGTFVNATPIANTIVVNAGDLLARWSNDTIKSTRHRVVEPPHPKLIEGMHPARYSVAYFCNPNFDRMIEAIPGTYDEIHEKKFPSINSGQYLVQRLTTTF